MPSPKSSIKEIAVAIDLAKGSSAVMRTAIAQAVNAGPECARLHLIHIAEPNIANVRPPDDMDAPELTGNDPHKLREFVAHRLAEHAKYNPSAPQPQIEIITDTGDPAEKICAHAASVDADLIVLGTHGRTGIKRLLIGSVAEKVVRLAGCPVLVVRDKQHAAGE
ncbi:MAG: universal stress protein [Polyangiaceae bacterium]